MQTNHEHNLEIDENFNVNFFIRIIQKLDILEGWRERNMNYIVHEQMEELTFCNWFIFIHGKTNKSNRFYYPEINFQKNI